MRSGSIAKAMLSVASLFPYSHPHPARVLAIRHTNDWVLNVCISGSLTLT